jgi:N-acetylmuramoyl-L-alanine amidase
MRVFVAVSVLVAVVMITFGLLASDGQGDRVEFESGTANMPAGEDDDIDPDSVAGSQSSTATATPETSNASLNLRDDRCFPGDSGAMSAVAGRTVILDPGHGGEDLGTVNRAFGFHESDFVLRISLDLKDRLVESGADVCLTRVEDNYIELMARSEFANEMDGDVFISIHLNSLPNPARNYTMTMWGSEAKDRFLAESILEPLRYKLATPQFHFGEPNPMNPEIYRLEDLDSSMLRSAEMPATLVEASFLSSTWEAQAFASGLEDGTRWREHQIADVIHEGLMNFFEAFQ